MAEQLQYPSGITILRLIQVKERTGLSRSTIYDRMNLQSPRYDPTFPSKVEIGPGAVGWVEAEVDAWLSSKVSADRSPVDNTRPIIEAKPALPPRKEPATAQVDVKPVDPDQAIIATVRQFLEEKIKRGRVRVHYPEVMASIHLWNDKPADREAMEKILESVTRTSHAENGILLGVIVHGTRLENPYQEATFSSNPVNGEKLDPVMLKSKAIDSRPVDGFFNLSKTLGYNYSDPEKFVLEQTLRAYEFFEKPGAKSRGRIRWFSSPKTDSLFLMREGSMSNRAK